MHVIHKGRRRKFRTVSYLRKSNEIVLIEQRLLPHEFRQIRLKTPQKTAKAITDMVVRGAGAIGATAAFGLAQGICAFSGKDLGKLKSHAAKIGHLLKAARPTAVDPMNAVNAMLKELESEKTVAAYRKGAIRLAEAFADEDVEHCSAIGELGNRLIRKDMKILTHCNAGWLAFVDIGSATAPLYAAKRAGKQIHVYCDETRPRCQGASLTAWELAQEGVSHEVIPDNAAGHLMQRGEIDMVITGADRVLGRSGEVTNKIGTYTKAVLANRHGIPFYVAIPLSTIDWELKDGMEIPIEERDESETLGAWGINERGRRSYVRIANQGSHGRNPAFDVTPPELVTGIITPVGIMKPTQLWKKRRQLGWKQDQVSSAS